MPRTTVLPNSSPARLATPPLPFACGWSDSSAGSAMVHVVGELDRATSHPLERTLREAQRHARLVVLDLRELEFIDCAGIQAIVDAHERAQQAGDQLAVVRGASRIDNLFTLTGLCDVLEIVDLDPGEPPIQALLELSGNRHVA